MPNQSIQMSVTIVPVILCGGSGTRLWPVSRKSYPKQFWPLISARTMLQETAARASGPGFAPPIVVANEDHRFIVAEQLRAGHALAAQILLEPEGRNSAPAIAAAAALAASTDPDALLWIMPADAAIADSAALASALAIAAEAARTGLIVTFGMQATTPETGYGYIEQGEPLAAVPGAYQIARFIEKPDHAKATSLIADGKHCWNSGMFVASARTLIDSFAELPSTT